MKLKGNIYNFFIIAFILVVVYTFIVPDTTGKDVLFSPKWSKEITDSNYASVNEIDAESTNFEPTDLTSKFMDGVQIPFIAKFFFGYHDADGNLLRVEPIKEGVSVTEKFWAVYSKSSLATSVYTPAGKKAFEIKTPGFIHLHKDRIFLFLPGGNAVEEYSDEGLFLWRYTMPSPITAFDSSESGGVIIGGSDGCLVYLDSNGKEVFNFYPSGSDYQVILGATVSRDGTKAACVSGLEKQRCLLIDLTTPQHKIVCHEYLSESIHKQVNMLFDYSGRYVIFESALGIGIMDFKKLDTKIAPIKGSIEVQSIQPYKGLFYVMTNLDNNCTLVLFDEDRRVVCKTNFESEVGLLVQNGAEAFVTLDTKIIKFNLGDNFSHEKK